MTTRALDLILSQPWAILPETLETILSIAARDHDGPEAVAARLGRPLVNARKASQRDQTAIIPVTGPIFRRANLMTEISGATSIEVLATDIQTALDDPEISRIVLEFDSPGGQATGIAELAALIRDRANRKPVVAYVDGMAASAAYWLAAAADSVILSPTALVGSIGVIASYRPEKDGPLKIVSSQSPLKHASPETPEGKSEMQRVVDELAAVFIGDVARFRGTDPDTVTADFGRGGVLVGAAAVAANMADMVGTLETLLAGSSGMFSTRSFVMANQATAQTPEMTRETLAAHHPALLSQIETAAQEAGFQAGHAAGLTDGAAAERARIQAVRAQALPGHDALVERLAFDGTTTAEQAAVQILAAERAHLDTHRAAQTAGPAPVPAALTAAAPAAPETPPVPTFETLVADAQTNGLTRGAAIMHVARAHPALHEAYLAQINRHTAAAA